MPNAGLVKSAEDGCKPGELRRFVNCPSSGDSEEAGSRNGKIGEPLKGVVFCAVTGMRLSVPRQYGVGQAQLISGHLRNAASIAQQGQE